jgi:hypothetical protein
MFLQVVDPTTATLFVAVLALSGTLIVTILDATVLETRRRYAEKTALTNALYNEIGWTFMNLIDIAVGLEITVAQLNRTPATWATLKHDVTSILCFDVYNSTRTQPTLFYQLPDAQGIENSYRIMLTLIKRVEDEEKANGKNTEDEATQVTTFIKIYVYPRVAKAISGLNQEKLSEATAGQKGTSLERATEIVDYWARIYGEHSKREAYGEWFLYKEAIAMDNKETNDLP